MKTPNLVLASSSPYRHALFAKLQLPFTSFVPDIDESIRKDESPSALVQRLAKEKAKIGRLLFSDSLIIGSDQICVIDKKIIGKPHTKENAIKQLTMASGKEIIFYTGLALLNTKTQVCQIALDSFHVHFRNLTQNEIENYIEKDMPLDCAGSFKSEGLGISLFNKLEGKDPNSLVGLPLITLCKMLRKEGVNI